jgi:hypothetical protein
MAEPVAVLDGECERIPGVLAGASRLLESHMLDGREPDSDRGARRAKDATRLYLEYPPSRAISYGPSSPGPELERRRPSKTLVSLRGSPGGFG